MGILFTFLITALIAFLIYIIQKRDQKKDKRQIIEEVRAEILSSSRENFSISELNEIIDNLVIDKDLVIKKDPLPYKKCPRCGSSTLKRDSGVEVDGDDTLTLFPLYFWETILCENCSWEKTAYIDREQKIISYKPL